MNWRGVEAYLARDDRAVLPIGSTEQHAGLSLATDWILAERVAAEAAEPLGVPVFPALAYGVTPYFMAFPGTVTLSAETYLRVVAEIIAGLAVQGFHRILVVNGHGGNSFARAAAEEAGRREGAAVKFHNWWNAPRTWAQVMATDPVAGHASWMENFPWTRLAGAAAETERKPPLDMSAMRALAPPQVRERIGDGNLGGLYQRPDAEMEAIWQAGVAETRRAIEEDWT
ncbi:MAG: creatininase family protein [Terriglobales bacterium]